MTGSMEARLRIKDLPETERPYERLRKFGAHMLSNAELLAIIIKTGTKSETSVDVARRLLNMDEEGAGPAFLNHLSLEELEKVKGIGSVKAVQIKALTELARRISSSPRNSKEIVKSPDDICRVFMEDMRYLGQEEFRILLLNTKNRILKTCVIAVGGLNVSSVEIREIFKEPIKSGCASIILIHNHPSGDPSPSNEDILFTKRVFQGGELIGIKVLDHVIIGDGSYCSMKERGLF